VILLLLETVGTVFDNIGASAHSTMVGSLNHTAYLIITYSSTTTHKENVVDKRFGYFVFGGLLIGALMGWAWSAGDNPLAGMGIGALVGVAVAWFMGAYVLSK